MPQRKAIQFPAPSTPGRRGLTPRQAECAALAHLPNADIGNLLDISSATVKKHIANACDRTGAGNRTHLVMLLKAA